MREALLGRPASPAWKYEAPRLGELLLIRERLIAKIEQALGRHRSSGDVFLVSAPAGYGKSTLLAQWSNTSKLPVAWYHVDISDEDPAIFLAGFVHALHERFPRARWHTSDLLRRMRAHALSPQDVERATEVLLQDLRANVTKPMAIILTGIAELSVTGATHDILDRLLTRPPDHLRIALEFREVPSLRLSPLLTQRRLDGIGVDDLKLDEDELIALLDRIGVPRDAAYTKTVRELCDGWVTGVVLATGALTPQFLASRSTYATSSGELNRAAVFDYLATEVIGSLSPELREFACTASVLSYMTAPLCEQLVGARDARQKLAALERQTGFITRFGQGPAEPAFRLQPLLRHALLERLDQAPSGPARRCELHLRAGQCLEEIGDGEEAFQQYLQAEAFDSIVALIQQSHAEMLRACQGATLMRWLDALPAGVRDRHPHLQVLLAELYRQTDRVQDALSAVESACAILQAQHTFDPVLMGRAMVARARVYYTLGRYAEAQDDCEAALRLVPAEPREIGVQAGLCLASCLLIRSTPEAAHASLQKIEEQSILYSDRWALARLHYFRSRLHMASGEYATAEREATAALVCAHGANDEVIAISSRLNLGAIRQYLGRLDAAREDLEAAIEQSEMAGYRPGRAYALSNLGDLELMLENRQRAIEMYEQALATLTARDDLHLRVYTTGALGYVLALEGQTDRAMGLVAPLLDHLRDEQHGADWTLLATVLGVAHYRAGQFAAAEHYLLVARDTTLSHGEVAQDRVRVELYLAALQLAQGHEREAADSLRAAFDVVASTDGSAKRLFEVRHLPELWPLVESLDHPLCSELVEQVRSRSREATLPQAVSADSADSADPASAGSSRSPVSIRIHTLGDPRVFAGSERIVRWQRPRVRDLLLFMAEQTRPVTADVILEAIWPDKNADEAEQAFRKTRYYLKEVLGQRCLELYDGRWQLTAECWLDTREFERLIDEGEQLAREGQDSEAALVLRQALALWQGPYLDDCYAEWTVNRRNALQTRYMRCVERLVELDLRLGRDESVMRLCYQILDLEPHNEAAHRGLMLCFARRGEYAQALEQFKQCVHELSLLEASPGSKTLALLESIRTRMRVSAAQFVEKHR
jgi:ATP/maltotriose-dependent transcriptional regulator MalT